MKLKKFAKDMLLFGSFTAVLLLLREFVVQHHHIPSSSMEPTLIPGDWVVGDKINHSVEDISRHDLVVFKSNSNVNKICGVNSDEPVLFIKRVVGLPGETITVTNGTVYINNTPLQEKFIFESPNYSRKPVTIPPENYMVFGDNRNNSCDSHIWGTLPSEQIISKIFWTIEMPQFLRDVQRAVGRF